ncbi:hypothetical protein Cfor_06545 [Coptotermes formosanus]|jgi:hypothetical protein|uniref:Uncharacterized protein n=1 Tax=Coptotermes formosanus TaxID=36987 RepID=A0A6L2PVZ4_COPFO|nr:hypothetical protein Cfor_06545 [Coptotermes formosanus]
MAARECLQEIPRGLNGFLQNLMFAMEKDKNGALPFMYVLGTRRADGTLGHVV